MTKYVISEEDLCSIICTDQYNQDYIWADELLMFAQPLEEFELSDKEALEVADKLRRTANGDNN